jgi:hypothetical protein
MGLAILVLMIAVGLGFYEGWCRSRISVVIGSGAAIVAVSNLAATWPSFSSDPSTWARTYCYGFLQTGVVSLLIHLVPFVIAYLFAARYQERLVRE